MEKEFHTGQCFSVTPYGQVHYYKVLCAEKGQATLVAYVSIYSDGIYVGEGANISISDNAVEIAASKFDCIFQEVKTKLLPIVECYTSFPVRLIDDTTQYIDNVPFHPKGQCFVKTGEGCVYFGKSKNPFEYNQITVEEIYVCSKPDCIGLYLFPSTRIDPTKGYNEIDRKDFTQLKRYTTNFTKPTMWAIKREFM